MRSNPPWLGLLVATAISGALMSAAFDGCLSSSACRGGVTCNCYPNGTCNPGLTCASNLCVVLPDGSGQPPPEEDATPTDDVVTVPPNDGPSASDTQSVPPMNDASGALNLVTNGDFSQGTADWGIVDGNGTFTATGGKGCVAAGANQGQTLGWPEAAQGAPPAVGAVLEQGASYTLSYGAYSTTSPLAMDAKVGQTMSPYTPDFETATDAVTTTVTTFTHTFTATTGDTSAGIAFAFTPTMDDQICFENVSLTKN
jgi:hypothetical protein